MQLSDLAALSYTGTLRFIKRLIRNFVIPNNAGPGQARTVIGPDVPAELTAYYAATPYFSTVAMAYLAYDSFNRYWYMATLGSVPTNQYYAMGMVDANLVVHEMLFWDGAFPTSYRRLLLGGFKTDPTSSVESIVEIDAFTDFKIETSVSNPVSQGRGLTAFAASVGNSAAVAVETVYLNASQTWVQGRCYKITLNYHCRGAGGATSAIMRLRRVNLAGGAYINDMSFPFQAAYSDDSSGTFIRYLKNTSGADIVQNLAWTWQPTGGGTAQMIGAAGIVGAFAIEDCGAATAYPNVNTVV